MAVTLSLLSSESVVPVIVSGMPVSPSSGAFWAVLTWVVIPGVLLIWGAYHSRREYLRGVHRKLRQLEIRLAAATPANAAVRAELPRPSPASRPSSLTARILLPAAAVTSPIPVFRQPLPGQAG